MALWRHRLVSGGESASEARRNEAGHNQEIGPVRRHQTTEAAIGELDRLAQALRLECPDQAGRVVCRAKALRMLPPPFRGPWSALAGRGDAASELVLEYERLRSGTFPARHR